ncbi:hypothetical protein [Klebsiella quasipneumoniae]|uniref:hypothetical protein n=1 Tax=Klebsiella quasipneumoniae TaxID=1463165 RepID=UPI00296EFEB1|nr:hypothetical protein [Klebsiella quasipneumoniae]MDW3821475.1 hypothetical protein [Klebsiella quasipneumoniae]
MSLDIIAYDPKKLKERKAKFKEKYGLSYKKFNGWMLTPSKDTFFYFLHPEFLKVILKSMKKWKRMLTRPKSSMKSIVFISVMDIFTFLEKNLEN